MASGFSPGTDQVPQHNPNRIGDCLFLAGERPVCRKLLRTAITLTARRSMKVEYAGQETRDRLVRHATILEMNVESYRRKAGLKRKRGTGDWPPWPFIP
jgi:hypothetical protein